MINLLVPTSVCFGKRACVVHHWPQRRNSLSPAEIPGVAARLVLCSLGRADNTNSKPLLRTGTATLELYPPTFLGSSRLPVGSRGACQGPIQNESSKRLFQFIFGETHKVVGLPGWAARNHRLISNSEVTEEFNLDTRKGLFKSRMIRRAVRFNVTPGKICV